jgi:lipoate-protein ligase A
VAYDAALLEAVRAGREPPTARVWGNARCLVVARSDARLPRFAAAREELAAAGWPVVVRESGGSAVPHGPGILSLSLAFRPAHGAPCTLESIYGELCRALELALERLGVRAERSGGVPDAFCDGRYDLAVGGRKIAGTAQRWRAGPGGPSPERGAVLAHALLLVDADRVEATEAVNRFYRAAGGARRARAEASITLREALASAGREALTSAGREALTEAGGAPPRLASAARGALAAALRQLAGCA